MPDKQPSQFKFVTSYGLQGYSCGVKVGDKVRLKHDIVIRYSNGEPSGEIRRGGEEWIVLTGSVDDPGVLWLRNSAGERWTWDDNASFFDDFEVMQNGSDGEVEAELS